MGTTLSTDIYLPVINGSDSVILDGSVLKIQNPNLTTDVYRISDWSVTNYQGGGVYSDTISVDFQPGLNRGVVIIYFDEVGIPTPAEQWLAFTVNGLDVSSFGFIKNPTYSTPTSMQFWSITEASLGDVSQIELYWQTSWPRQGVFAIGQFANTEQNNFIGDVSLFGSDTFVNPMTNVNIDVAAGSYAVGAGVNNILGASGSITELEEQFETYFGATGATCILGDNPYPDSSIAINYITWTIGNRNVAGTFEIKKY